MPTAPGPRPCPRIDPYQPRPALLTGASMASEVVLGRPYRLLHLPRIGDVERYDERAVAVLLGPRTRDSSGRRAVSATRSPISRAASAKAMPNPPGVPPVTNHVFVIVGSGLDHQSADQCTIQGETEVQVGDPTREVPFQVLHDVDTLRVPRGPNELGGEGETRGRIAQPIADVVAAAVQYGPRRSRRRRR